MKIVRTPRKRLKIVRSAPRFWSAHTHSVFSAQDALPSVPEIVARVAALGQQGLALTDHGNMAGSVQLYKECTKAGIKPFPGTEFYLVDSIAAHKADRANKEVKASRFHLGVLAYTTQGYRNLVRLNTVAHKQHFHKPLIDFATLADFAEHGYTAGLAVTTGCYFGKVAQTVVNSGLSSAAAVIGTLDSWFPGATYVEIQNHNIDHGDGWNDSVLADALVDVADQMGLPVIITQDSHYVNPTDKEDHDALKRLVAFGPEPDDAVFPGDGFHLADDAWIASHHTGHRLDRGYEGLRHLLDAHDLAIGSLDSYSYAVPLPVPNPDVALRKRCENAMQASLGRTKNKYWDRLDEELEVINHSGFAGYLLLTAQITDYMREAGIVFQTRGSAGGSLVNYLLGITYADPVHWNLRFERFLSKDRTKPPDIDLDIEHERRDEVIAWISSKYAVHQIGTWSELSMSGDEDSGKGSLLVKYFSASRKSGGATTWDEVPEAHRQMLRRLSDRKLFAGAGTNAAGLVITSTTRDFEALAPQMYMSDKDAPGKYRLLSQYDKDDIEKLGLVKLDVMGLKTLTVISKAVKLIGNEGLEWIPANDKRTYNFIKTGRTEGCFQLSGGATSRGLRDLKPTTIKDVIAAMALFRPATMKSGATEAYIRRKHRAEALPQRHQIIDAATKDTFGILLFQEQVIQVLRELGMGAEDLTQFLKAIKASNKDVGGAGDVISGYMSHVHTLCQKAGMTEDDMAWLEEALEAYSGYGFNSSHATIYGITAYRSAYLVVHHPLEFHTALLGVFAGDKDKEPKYVRATRDRGIKILAADINTSGYTYTIDRSRGAIRRGLLSVRGVGQVAAAELIKHQPYESLADLCERVDHRKITGVKDQRLKPSTEFSGTLLALHEAGALDSIL